MLDQSLGQKLRAALRAEGDDLSFTITAEELQRRLATRRRGGMSPLASLGLAAAVGVGLIGLAGVVGGWFEQRPAVLQAPSPSPVVAPPSPSASTEASPGVATLPTLDDMLADIDLARVVRAEAVGPTGGPGTDIDPYSDLLGPGSVTFDPVATSGSYDVLAACAGDGRVLLTVARADGQSIEEVPITCDGVRSLRQMGLEAGSALEVTSAGKTAWRVVLESPERAAPHATAIDTSDIKPAGADVLVDQRSATETPSYAELLTGGGIETRTPIGGVPVRTRYDVYVTCAGPSPIRYAFGSLQSPDAPVDPGQPIDDVAGEVECDGTLQHDTIEVTLGGPDIAVTAEDRTAWRVIVTAEKPPISIPVNGGGWTMSTAIGPNLSINGITEEFSLIGSEAREPVRVIISCAGETTVTGTIEVVVPSGSRPDPFSIDCSGRSSDTTFERVYQRGSGQVDIVADPHGKSFWLVAATMVRVPASPVP